MAEEEIRQKYVELQMAAEQMKQMQAQLQALEAKSAELEANMQSFEELKGQKSAELLAPIAEGIFLKAELKNEEEVIVNAGAGVCVRKSVEEAKKMLLERRDELNDYVRELTQQIENGAESMRNLEEELGKMVRQSKNV